MAQAQIFEGTGEELIPLLDQQPKARFRLIRLPENPYPSFEEALAQAVHRTPEEIMAARERILSSSPSPRELPEGKTLEDVVVGQWPGDESDEQIFEALKKLS